MEFYDVGSSDLRELWESYLVEPALGNDVLPLHKDDDWCGILNPKDKSLGVVLRDRLMTDAALGGPRPIKSEHSYSLLTCSPPASPATPGGNPHTPNSGANGGLIPASNVEGPKVITLRTRIDDMEEECFPAISMDTASGRGSSPPPASLSANLPTVKLISSNKRSAAEMEESICLEIKGEPISAPSSPTQECVTSNFIDTKAAIAVVSPHRLHFASNHVTHTSDSEEDDEEYYQNMELEFDVDPLEKTDTPRGNRQSLPPTPPSSASSDSEGAASCSPERRDSQSSSQNLRNFLSPRLYVSTGHSTRQPIHTSLISTQPKGSTGILTLTEEEKRTLIAEGYPVPTKLPLTKQEEKSLKKVRRKIKNKISAQESRRKKKEYMDGLERRVTMLTNENSNYRERLSTLEDNNQQLLKELERLQAMLDAQKS